VLIRDSDVTQHVDTGVSYFLLRIPAINTQGLGNAITNSAHQPCHTESTLLETSYQLCCLQEPGTTQHSSKLVILFSVTMCSGCSQDLP